jgi:hypothetical protein
MGVTNFALRTPHFELIFLPFVILVLFIKLHDKMKIEIIENGPYIVKGKNTIVNTDGSVVENENDVYLCRCGKSANKPYCDGTHKEI